MLILPFALILGALVGAATGGSFRALGKINFRWGWIVVAAVAVQAALSLPGVRTLPSGIRFALVIATYLVVGWWLYGNARATTGGPRLGVGLVAAGWILNFVAIVPNGGMPVSASAMREAGFPPSFSVTNGHLSKHVLASSGTYLRFLGDAIPVRPFQAVVSAGDVVMFLGIVVFLATAMHRSPLRLHSASSAKEAPEAPRSSSDSPSSLFAGLDPEGVR